MSKLLESSIKIRINQTPIVQLYQPNGSRTSRSDDLPLPTATSLEGLNWKFLSWKMLVKHVS